MQSQGCLEIRLRSGSNALIQIQDGTVDIKLFGAKPVSIGIVDQQLIAIDLSASPVF